MANVGGARRDRLASRARAPRSTIAWPAGGAWRRRPAVITVPRWLLLALGGAVLGVPRRARHLLARRRRARRGRPSSRWCSTRSRRSSACGRRGACGCRSGWPRSTSPCASCCRCSSPASSTRRRQRLRHLVRRRGRHADDDRGGAAAAGVARGSASSSSPCRRVVWAGPALARRARRDRQHRLGRGRAHAHGRARQGRPRDPPLRAGRARGRRTGRRRRTRTSSSARCGSRQTNRIAAPMLRRIADRGGDLTDDQRRECRKLEAAIRDEIRGRMLLNDAVRAAGACAPASAAPS